MVHIQTTYPATELLTRFRIFVYHHTHWDREWWAPLQDFRIRLVELIDDLLATLAHDAEFRCFLLDGQTIVLKDYLEIRPEQRERLVAYLNAGHIQCGPWYVLPDEFLVSGEAHIRNLWLGERMARRLGYRNQAVGYLPDTFGHIAQMPQILRGFGLDSAMIWRGAGGDPAIFKQEFWWEAADDSQVLAHWFPDGYYLVDFLHFDNPQKSYAETYGRVRRTLELCAERATSDCILLPYGGDHRPIDRRLPRLLRQVNAELHDFGELYWATPAEYLAAVRESQADLGVVKGELRDFGPGLPHLLPGVLSTRLYLKQRNAEGQTWLERYAEPLAALAARYGRPYDASLLWTAWEFLVQNHPHDSICGCSIDQVHREMLTRFDQSLQIARIVAEKSAQHINAQIDTAILNADELALVVHNPLAWERSDLVRVLVAQSRGISPHSHILRDAEGNEVPFQVRAVAELRPQSSEWQHSELCFIAAEVPALGYATYRLSRREALPDPRQKSWNTLQPAARLKGSAAVSDLRVGDGVIENRWLRVEVERYNGTLKVLDRVSGALYTGLNAFEDSGDAGDEYSYAAPLCDTLLRSDQGARVHTSIDEAGYARATLRIDLDWALPTALSSDRLSRAATYVETRITTFVSLAADARHIEITTEWENRSQDHRLRALFPLGVPVAVAHAESQFAVLTRPVTAAATGNGWAELPATTLPQQGFVSVNAGRRGLTIANRGLPEYEVLHDGTIALTLLRAVGWLSRDDLLNRVGEAGPAIPTPEAQCLGRQRVEYALLPHAGNWLETRAYCIIHNYLAPLYGSTTGAHGGEWPWRDGLLRMEGDHTLLLSACKQAEDNDALILRFWNVADQPSTAQVYLRERPRAVAYVNLKEEPLTELPIAADGSFALYADGAKIVSVAIWF